jgi:glycosyltransferase involved in cell wall biosynthesis
MMNYEQHEPRPHCGVGVVIPVYNRANTLLRTLPHVVAQTAPLRKLVIVDDGSSDDSAGAAERWLGERCLSFGWQVLRSRHVGAAAARNIGLAALGPTRYVAFLDSDDHWPADFLERTSTALDANPAAVAASADRRYLLTDGAVNCDDDCFALARSPIEWMFDNGAGISSCTLLRRDVVHEVGDWPDYLGIAEDFRLFVEVAQHGPWLHCPGAPVDFCLGSAAACGEADNLSQRYESGDWRWVCIYEQVYQELCERRVPFDRGKVQQAIARVWNRAGKSFLTRGDRDEARQCFVKSIRWKPAQLRAWRRLVVNALAGGRRCVAADP